MRTNSGTHRTRRRLLQLSGTQLRRALAATIVLATTLVVLVDAPPAAAAPPVPSTTLSVAQPNPLIGETLSFEVALDNSDLDATGYMP